MFNAFKIIFVIQLFCLATFANAQEIAWEPHAYAARSGEKVEAQLGHLAVPENRNNPNSRTITLAFVRFPATTQHPGPPIVYLAGGPGGSGIESARGARFPIFMAMRAFGDVIALDQRGVGQSEPDMAYRAVEALPIDKPATRAAMAALYVKHVRAMSETMAAKGIELAGYTTDQNADDVNALRIALGAEKITLWGTSYGTHLSFPILRRYGEHIDRVILHGTEGPDHTDKLPSDTQRELESIAAAVRTDAALSEHIPDFMALATEVVQRFAAAPVTINLSPTSDSKREIVVGDFELRMFIAENLRDRQSIAGLPAALYRIQRGDYLELGRWAFGARRFMGTSAMFIAMDTASGASPERQARISREAETCLLQNAINFPFPEVREVACAPDAGDAFRGPLQSNVPTLFISGTLDGRTPISNAEEMLRGFPNGQHVIVENIGHGDDLFTASPEILAAMQAFMSGTPLPNKHIHVDIEFEPVTPTKTEP